MSTSRNRRCSMVQRQNAGFGYVYGKFAELFSSIKNYLSIRNVALHICSVFIGKLFILLLLFCGRVRKQIFTNTIIRFDMCFTLKTRAVCVIATCTSIRSRKLTYLNSYRSYMCSIGKLLKFFFTNLSVSLSNVQSSAYLRRGRSAESSTGL